MKKDKRPEQFTALLMLPVSRREAQDLARIAASPGIPEGESYNAGDILKAHLHLLLGIAAIEDDGVRQLTALNAAEIIFSFTSDSSEALVHYVSSIYGEDVNTKI